MATSYQIQPSAQTCFVSSGKKHSYTLEVRQNIALFRSSQKSSAPESIIVPGGTGKEVNQYPAFPKCPAQSLFKKQPYQRKYRSHAIYCLRWHEPPGYRQSPSQVASALHFYKSDEFP
jgi:hypothetical protein